MLWSSDGVTTLPEVRWISSCNERPCRARGRSTTIPSIAGATTKVTPGSRDDDDVVLVRPPALGRLPGALLVPVTC